MAPETLFTFPSPNPYPTCALTNSNFWCLISRRSKNWREPVQFFECLGTRLEFRDPIGEMGISCFLHHMTSLPVFHIQISSCLSLEHVLQKWEEASSYIFPDWRTMLRTWTAEIHCNLCDGCYTDGYAYQVGVSSFCGRHGGHFVSVILSSSQNS